ncbi:MAG TPA: hypothetical protein VF216_03125, partial [Mizugakiibacter sp.]
ARLPGVHAGHGLTVPLVAVCFPRRRGSHEARAAGVIHLTARQSDRGRRRGQQAMRRLYYLDGQPFTAEQLAARLGAPVERVRLRLYALRRAGKPIAWETLRCGPD